MLGTLISEGTILHRTSLTVFPHVFMPLHAYSFCSAVLMLRTYAIWGRTRWVRIVLICVSILLYPPAIAVTQLELQSLKCKIPVQRPIVSILILFLVVLGGSLDIPASYLGERGCFLSHASSIIYVAYILLGLSETSK